MPISFFRSTPAVNVPAVSFSVEKVSPPWKRLLHLWADGGMTVTAWEPPVTHAPGCTWFTTPQKLYSPKVYGVCIFSSTPVWVRKPTLPDLVSVNVPSSVKTPLVRGTLIDRYAQGQNYDDLRAGLHHYDRCRQYRPPTFTHLTPKSRTFFGTVQIGTASRDTADFGSAIMWMFAVTGLLLALPSTATRARPRTTFRAKLNAPTATLLRARTSRLWSPLGRATVGWME